MGADCPEVDRALCGGSSLIEEITYFAGFFFEAGHGPVDSPTKSWTLEDWISRGPIQGLFSLENQSRQAWT
jgi:hypothetical protein